MDVQLRRGLLALVLLLPTSTRNALSQPFNNGLTEELLIQRSTDQLMALQVDPATNIPPQVIAQAQGIALFPDIVKAGFLIGARVGHGLIVLRLPDGSWSQPVFLTLTGGSIGLQAGVASSDVVLVFRNRQSIERFLLGKGTLALNGDASIALGPHGSGVGGATNLRLSADVLAYGRNRGFFAGVSGGGSSISIARRRNLDYYGQLGLDPNAVLTSPDLTSTPEVDALHQAIADLEGVPVIKHEAPAPPPASPATSRRIIQSTPKPIYVPPRSNPLELNPDFGDSPDSPDALEPPPTARAAPSLRSFTRPYPYYYDLPAPRPRPVATPIKPPANPAPGAEAPKIEPPKTDSTTGSGLPEPA